MFCSLPCVITPFLQVGPRSQAFFIPLVVASHPTSRPWPRAAEPFVRPRFPRSRLPAMLHSVRALSVCLPSPWVDIYSSRSYRTYNMFCATTCVPTTNISSRGLDTGDIYITWNDWRGFTTPPRRVLLFFNLTTTGPFVHHKGSTCATSCIDKCRDTVSVAFVNTSFVHSEDT